MGSSSKPSSCGVQEERKHARPSQPSPQGVSQRSQLVRESIVREQQYRARMQRMTREQQNAFNELNQLMGRSGAPQASAVSVQSSNRFQPLRTHYASVSEMEHKYDDALNDVGPRVPQAPPMHRNVPQAPPLEEALVDNIASSFGERRGHRRAQFQRDLRQAHRNLHFVGAPALGVHRFHRLVLEELVARQAARDEMVALQELQDIPPLDDVPPPALSPRDPKEDGPGDGIIGYRDRRMLNTLFETRNFDYLDFMGKWNPSRVSEQLFVKHFGLHFNERQIQVRLPASLVAEMKDWWSHRVRDSAWENFSLSVARCRVLVSELAITADEQQVANMYAPAIAFLDSWDEQQNVSRVVQRAHVDLRRRTWPKVRQSLRTKTGKVVAAGAGLCVVGAVVGLVVGKQYVSNKATKASSAIQGSVGQVASLCLTGLQSFTGVSSSTPLLLGTWLGLTLWWVKTALSPPRV